MKALIKIIALMLIVVLIPILPTIAAENVSSHVEYDQRSIKVLSSLGILDKTIDAVKLDKDVTRAEFASLIIRFINPNAGLVSSTDSKFSFADVAEDNANLQNIRVAYLTGIMGGVSDVEFKPDETITLYQAVKAVLCTLGYTKYAQIRGGYPLGYMTTANEKNLLSGLNLTGDVSMKFGDVIRLLYNALDTDIMKVISFSNLNETVQVKKGVNVLSEYYKINKIKAIMTAVGKQTLAVENGRQSDMVMLDGNRYNSKATEIDELLGMNVDAYLQEINNEQVLITAVARDNNIIINFSDETIDRFDGISDVYFFESADKIGKSVKASLSSAPYIVYNGLPKPGTLLKDVMPSEGTVKLIDNNDDGFYEVALVKSYINYVVDSVNIAEGIITDKYAQLPLVMDNSRDIDVKVFSGSDKLTLKDIKKGDILSVYANREKIVAGNKAIDSDNSDMFIINVVKSSIGGKINEIDSDSIMIDGKKYKVSNSYTQAVQARIAQDLKLEIGGTFSLDISGKIAAFNVDVEAVKMQLSNYGYLVNAAKSTGVSGDVDVKLLSAENKIVILKTEATVKIDGASVKKEQFLSKFSDANSQIIPQLIMYDLSENGKIKAIDSQHNGTNEDSNSNLSLDYTSRTYDSIGKDIFNTLYYSSWGKNFSYSTFKLNDSAKVFVVPVTATTKKDQNGNEYASYDIDKTKLNKVDDFHLYGPGYFGNECNISLNDNQFTISGIWIDVYNLSKEKFSDLMVVYKEVAGATTPNVDLSAPMGVVERISRTVNDNGEIVPKLYLFLPNKTTLTEVSFADEDAVNRSSGNDIKQGDVVRYQLDNNGYINKLVRALKFDEMINANRNNLSAGFISESHEIYYGQVYAKGSNGIVIDCTKDMPLQSVGKISDTVTLSPTNNIIIYDENSGKARAGSWNDIYDYETTKDASLASLVYTHSGSGFLSDVIIFLLKK